MKKIKLKKPLWNHKKDDVLQVSVIRAEFAIRKGYAEEVEQVKPKQAPENKAEKKPKKNK